MGMTSGMRKQATAPKANTMATPVAKVVTFSVINSNRRPSISKS